MRNCCCCRGSCRRVYCNVTVPFQNSPVWNRRIVWPTVLQLTAQYRVIGFYHCERSKIALYSSTSCSPAEWSGSSNSEQSVFALIDSTGRRRSESKLFTECFHIKRAHAEGKWDEGLCQSLHVQLSIPMCNFRLNGQPIEEKNRFRQTDWLSSIYRRNYSHA